MVCDCVKSILDTCYPDIEVFVVDDCSPDNTRSLIAERFGNDSRVRYLRNKKNSLSAHSRNHGAAYAFGDYLLFLDDDNIVHKDIFTELMASFARHPDAGLIAPLTCNVDGDRRRIWTVGSYFNPWTSQCADARPLPEFVEDVPSSDEEYETMYSPNVLMVTRTAFDSVGGFDEVMRMQFEESDFGYRVVEAGYKAFISSRARTDHYGYRDPDTVPVLRGLGIGRPARAYSFGRNRTIFARRHFSFLQALVVAIVVAPLSALYYGWVALKNRRIDIAGAYCAGTFAGIFHIYPASVFDCKVGSACA